MIGMYFSVYVLTVQIPNFFMHQNIMFTNIKKVIQ